MVSQEVFVAGTDVLEGIEAVVEKISDPYLKADTQDNLAYIRNPALPERCEEFKPFLDVDPGQLQKFVRLDAETQVEIFLCGMRRELKDVHLGMWLTHVEERGGGVSSFVIETLRTEQNEIRKRDLVYLLATVAAAGRLRDRMDVFAEVRSIVEDMPAGYLKVQSQRRLSMLEFGIRHAREPRISSVGRDS